MLAQEQTLLKIGELSTRSGVSVKTIRYYEEIGLLRACGRTQGLFRLFDPEVVARLAFIKRLQALGLSLQGIGECLAVYDHGDLPCHDIHLKLECQVAEIDRQVAELMLLRHELTDVLQRWSVSLPKQPGTICPNLQV